MDKPPHKFDLSMLEMYALGGLSKAKALEIEAYAAVNADFAAQLDEILQSLEEKVVGMNQAPVVESKNRFLSEIDALEGELEKAPRHLHPDSKPADYAALLELPAAATPSNLKEFQSRILDVTGDVTTMLVWVPKEIPPETHRDVLERLLILEGSCIIDVAGQKHELAVGDNIAIPLHLEHSALITSSVPCKALVQHVQL